MGNKRLVNEAGGIFFTVEADRGSTMMRSAGAVCFPGEDVGGIER